ncbi:hypothetical protein AAMO2058_001288300 [Amorphochlora amoebiformis]
MSQVKVAVRVRPFIKKESKTTKNAVEESKEDCLIRVREGKSGESMLREKATWREFQFDTVYTRKSTQSEVFSHSVKPIVSSFVEGFNCTVFAYGQTSSGKTFTMMGDLSTKEFQGIIPRSIDYLFECISNQNQDGQTFMMTVSYLEIYNEKVFDLLTYAEDRSPLKIRQARSGFLVPDLTQHIVTTREKVIDLIEMGNQNRSVASTSQNSESSRSHSLLTVDLERTSGEGLLQTVVCAKLNLVDLAGSERFQSHSSTVQKESASINQSLNCLANVISALSSNKPGKFVPYRNSALTRLLKDSLGGNSNTLMFANINPCDRNVGETISTLRYAARAKNIKNKLTKVLNPKDALLTKLSQEIKKLRVEMKEKDEIISRLQTSPSASSGPLDFRDGDIVAPKSIRQREKTDAEKGRRKLMELLNDAESSIIMGGAKHSNPKASRSDVQSQMAEEELRGELKKAQERGEETQRQLDILRNSSGHLTTIDIPKSERASLGTGGLSPEEKRDRSSSNMSGEGDGESRLMSLRRENGGSLLALKAMLEEAKNKEKEAKAELMRIAKISDEEREAKKSAKDEMDKMRKELEEFKQKHQKTEAAVRAERDLAREELQKAKKREEETRKRLEEAERSHTPPSTATSPIRLHRMDSFYNHPFKSATVERKTPLKLPKRDDAKLRLMWQIGSELWIRFSKLGWTLGKIRKIYRDKEGEWLVVRGIKRGKKEASRYNRKVLMPVVPPHLRHKGVPLKEDEKSFTLPKPKSRHHDRNVTMMDSSGIAATWSHQERATPSQSTINSAVQTPNISPGNSRRVSTSTRQPLKDSVANPMMDLNTSTRSSNTGYESSGVPRTSSDMNPSGRSSKPTLRTSLSSPNVLNKLDEEPIRRESSASGRVPQSAPKNISKSLPKIGRKDRQEAQEGNNQRENTRPSTPRGNLRSDSKAHEALEGVVDKVKKGSIRNLTQVDNSHAQFELVSALLHGLKHGAVKWFPPMKEVTKKMCGQCLKWHFTHALKGCVLPLPKHVKLKGCEFKMYAPEVFQRLRTNFGIQQENFITSIVFNQYIEFVSNSKSGAFFFFSNDARYMIKTVEQAEAKTLTNMLYDYYNHVTAYKGSLLCRICGLFRLQLDQRIKGIKGTRFYFIIMESVFATSRYIHLIYDLKGSSHGREATEQDMKKNPTNNFTGTIVVGKSRAGNLKRQIKIDSKFLESQGVIDYSLLLGVHYPLEATPLAFKDFNNDSAPSSPVSRLSWSNSGRIRGTSIPVDTRAGYKSTIKEFEVNQRHIEEEKKKLSRQIARSRASSEAASGFSRSKAPLPASSKILDRAIESSDKHSKEVYFVGIIDTLVQYNLRKRGEYVYKSKVKGLGTKMSVVPPTMYQKRFQDFCDSFIQ